MDNVSLPHASLGLWLKAGANRDLLLAYLVHHFKVCVVDGEADAAARDLLIIDSPTFLAYRSDLRALRERLAPRLLPVLLMLPSDAEPPPDQTLWPVADEWLFMPCTKRELLARLRVLLRARRLSLAQDAQAVALLQESEERYQQISSLVADAAYALRSDADAQLSLAWLSDQASQRLGLKLNESADTPFDGWSDDAQSQALYQSQVELGLGGASSEQVFLARRPRGGSGWVRSFVRPWNDAEGRLVGVLGALQDIDTEQRLTRQLQQFRLAMEQSAAPVLVFEPLGQCTYANPAYLHSASGDVTSKVPNALTLFGTVFEQAAQGAGSEGIFSLTDDAGQKRQFSVQLSPVVGEGGVVEAVVAVATDLTERLYYEQKLQRMATRDELTGLPNRTLLMEYLHDHLSRREHCALVMVCFSNLSQVNEAHGHEFGNVVLKGLGERLQGLVPANALLARVSGNEFAVVLAGAGPKASLSSDLGQWLHALRPPLQGPGSSVVPEMNLGISQAPEDAGDASDLFQLAQSALNSCRQKGANRFLFFDPVFNDAARRRLALESELQQALERGEFVLFFQPQVPDDPADVWGCEALLRWQHPTRGLVPPIEFIGLLEDTGLIHEVGAWVWAESQRALRALQAMGYGRLRVSVNVSPRQVERLDAMREVFSTADAELLAGGMLALELTESCLMGNPAEAMAIFRQLNQQGLHLSIDDFGTGYSSLLLLTELPLAELKIDQSFTRKLLIDGRTASLVSSLIDMAKRLGMRLVAEGVEEVPQVQALRRMGCDLLQGYWYSRPVPLSELPQTLKRLGYPVSAPAP